MQPGAGALAATVVLALGVAGLAAVPDAGQWEAHAQSDTVTVEVGALVSTGDLDKSKFPDDYREAAVRHAVEQFNMSSGDIKLDLSVTSYMRNGNASDPEPAVLIGAYDNGGGPRFYIGPMTSQGLENILNNGTSAGLLAGDSALLITPSSEAPHLALRDNIFRLAFNVAEQGDTLVDEMKSAGIASYVVVARSDAWGREAAAAAEASASQEGLEKMGRITFDAGRDDAYWAVIAGNITTSIGEVPDGERAGVIFLGYGDDYPSMASAANSSGALRGSTAWFAPSTAGVYTNGSRISDDTVRDFSSAVGLTALSQDVERNSVTTAIDGLDDSKAAAFYEYSAYDTVFVLGNAMRMAMAAGGNASDVASVKEYIADAAMNYTGGALGDSLLLDGNGDLRAPDRFTVHKVGADGEWSDGGTSSSAVTRVGALLGLDNDDYSDDKAWEALRQAAADYNSASGRTSLVKMITYDITDPANSSRYVAADVLRRAHDGGAGPSAYIGPSLSSNVEAVLPYASENDILLLGYGSEAESLSIADDNLFRTAITAARQGHFMARIMADANASSAVTVFRDDAWGRSLNASIVEALGANGLELAGTVRYAENDAASAAGAIAAAVAAAGNTSSTGVAFVGTENEQDDIAADPRSAAFTGTQWFVTPTGFNRSLSPEANPATSDFARAVQMRAIVLDVGDSAKKAALDARVPGLDFYGYSAYDALFVLGNAIESAIESGRTGAINATDLGGRMHAAADAYVGVLGDIRLNTNGDLRSPDRFAVWQVGGAGTWADTGVAKETPIVEVGALLAIDSADYPDNLAWDAVRRAALDYNGAGERPFYLDANLYDIANQSDAAKYVAAEALERAHASGDGPSVYIGPSLSSNIEGAVYDYAQANDIILLGYASEAESLSIPGDNLFRTAIPAGRQGHFMVQVMADANVSSVVTVVRDDAWGRSMSESIAEALGPNGLELAGAVTFAPGGGADWASAVGEIAGAVAERPGAAVAFVGVKADQDAMAAAASGSAAATGVPWFVTPSGFDDNMSAATRAFAQAVNMTAVVLEVADSAKKAALDARIPGLTFYEYAAYDGLFVLGSAIEAAAGTGGGTDGINATGLRTRMPAAAYAYEGALGDIVLDANGDLFSPAAYAVHRMGADGDWARERVVDAGAADCADAATRCITIGELYTVEFAVPFAETYYAHQLAVEDFNREQASVRGAQRVHLELQRVEISRESPVDGLRAAHAGGAGPSAYVGPATSRTAVAIEPFVNANDIVLLSMASASQPAIAKPDNIFRISLNDRYEADLLVIAAERENVTTIIPVVRDDAYGRSYDVEIRAEAALLELTVLDTVVLPAGESDLSGVAADLDRRVAAAVEGAGGPSGVALFVAAFNVDMHNLAHYAVDYPALLSVSWYNPGTLHPPRPLTDPETLRLAREAPLFSTSWALPQTGELDRIHDLFRAEIGHEPSQFSYAAYDSVFLLADAVNASIMPDGTYTGAGVAAAMHRAAERLDGLIGDDLSFDANGDRVSPSSVVVWRSAPGTGAWEEVDRVHLEPMCSLSLGEEKIEFGDIRGGERSAAKSQSITATGTVPIDTVTITAAPWTGGAGLPAGATEVMSSSGASAVPWTSLGSAVTVGEAGGPALPWVSSVEFRVSAPAVVAQDAAGPIEQTITYAAECSAAP